MKKNCEKDIEIYSSFREELQDIKILITGGTGLIGSVLAERLLDMNEYFNAQNEIILLVRNKEKLSQRLLKASEEKKLTIIIGDVCEFPPVSGDLDYIIHAASITVSRMMVENPVEVIKTNLEGTINCLELGRQKKIKAMIYLSTMEVYGFTQEEMLLKENNIQYLNPLALRSSYPESKRMAENLCISYANEYGVPVKIIRLAQTFGRGVKENDTRVFAEFARCARENKDIHLATDGKSKRMYLETEDAVRAVLAVLLKGNVGEAYNAANKETYCSIKEMAEFVSKEISGDKIKIEIDKNKLEEGKFPPLHKLKLDVSKIEAMGWKPLYDLKAMYIRMMDEWNEISER
mgnify:FL=1